MPEKCYPRLRQKGQVTIPKDIRDELGLEQGERVKLTVERTDDD